MFLVPVGRGLRSLRWTLSPVRLVEGPVSMASLWGSGDDVGLVEDWPSVVGVAFVAVGSVVSGLVVSVVRGAVVGPFVGVVLGLRRRSGGGE